jgi:GMP synthase (glutamine-hydrolysing)
MEETIIIFDFGSQYTQLIARRVREQNIYCEIHPFSKFSEFVSEKYISSNNINGIILSGSPFSVNDANSPQPNLKLLPTTIPVLGICYGAQLLVHQFGGKVTPSKHREYGRAELVIEQNNNHLFANVEQNSHVWMSHGDSIVQLPENFVALAKTKDIPFASFQIKDTQIFGLQFHPEVTHSDFGSNMLSNFLNTICSCNNSWTSASFINQTVSELKQKIGNDNVVLGLSGGVDSTVAAVLLHKAIGKNLYCIFVDNGLLRKNEFENVLETYKTLGLNIKGVDAKSDFYNSLKNLSDPELKRKAIGKTFIDVFDREAKLLTNVKWLAQGTIYPDVIESISVNGPSVTIKSHHNVGGLPDKMDLKVVEPLRVLFKDEVRRIGKELGIPSELLGRHPFPGPGLAIRILGEVTEEKIKILQDADEIFITTLIRENLYDQVWQAGTIFLPVQSVGVMGDERTYENAVALRAVVSHDGMTADWCKLPYDVLGKISNEIINKVKGINRVVYDISSKPPATIEWE